MATRKTAKKTKAKAAKKKSAAVKKKAPAAKKRSTGRKKATVPKEEILRRMLLQKRDEILKETQAEIAKYIKGENRQLVETALDGGDWSVIDLSEDINLRKLSTNRDTLVKIEESIRKLRENTYGVCEDCGERINPERLKVLPFAIRCRDCQESKEELEAAEREEHRFF
jgi:DnaK suppressor protein